MSYSSVSIIYNPKSSGHSKRNAIELQRLLQKEQTFAVPVDIIPTERAGHAEELAYELAKASPKPLIISASGDGGYHEVINGVVRAQAEGAEPTTGLLPSGNANDHYHSIRSGATNALLHNEKPRSIDLLHISVTSGKDTWERYAHSYVGIGITAAASIRYNQNKLNPLKEWVISFQTIYHNQPSKVLVDGTEKLYDSLIVSNVNRLGKIFVTSSTARVDDGKFEIIGLQSKSKAELLQQLAKALATRTSNWSQASEFAFTTVDKQDIQMDGEIRQLPAGAKVEIRCKPRMLRCII